MFVIYLFLFSIFNCFLCKINEVILNDQKGCPPSERSALVDVFNNMGGTSWFHKDNWLNGDPCEKAKPWYGVFCDGNSHVVTIILSRNNLLGSIPNSIGDLSELHWFDFSNNDLSGGIPATFTKLEKLQGMCMLGCGLSGSFPKDIGKLKQLNWIKMDNNNLSGPFPDSFWDLTNVIFIALYGNSLTGSISPKINDFQGLLFVSLSNNALSGELPDFNLPRLHNLQLDGNNFTGKVPKLGSSKQVMEVRLSRNLLDSEIPSEYESYRELSMLMLDSNNITGGLPKFFGGMENLLYFNVSDNQIRSLVPVEYKALSERNVDLSSNPLNCPLPDWLNSTLVDWRSTCVWDEGSSRKLKIKFPQNTEQKVDIFQRQKSTGAGGEGEEKVKVNLFGMQKCPDLASIQGIFHDIFAREGLLDILDYQLDFIGNVDDTQPTGIYTMHGQVEAVGSLMVKCVDGKYGVSKTSNFLQCLNKNQESIPSNGVGCAKQNGIPEEWFLNCTFSAEAKRELQDSVLKAEKFGAIWSPTIYINEEFYCRWHSFPCKASSPNDFLRDVCAAYKGQKPKGCP